MGAEKFHTAVTMDRESVANRALLDVRALQELAHWKQIRSSIFGCQAGFRLSWRATLAI
jgi:hypothetical protein